MTTTTDLIPIAPSVPGNALPDLSLAVAHVERLIGESAADVLDDARRKAEAGALYEKRAGNAERERHYGTLRVLAEAGLGVLSFDDPTIIPQQTLRSRCRALATALERGKLLDLCRELGVSDLPNQLRRRGYTYAPGKPLGVSGSVPWAKARALAAEKSVPLVSIPPDIAYVRRRDQQSLEQGREMQRMWDAARRLERMKRQKLIAAAAKEKSSSMAKAYSLLRNATQALHDAQAGMSRSERRSLDRIFGYLYSAEDEIGELLRVPETDRPPAIRDGKANPDWLPLPRRRDRQ